MPGPRLRLSNSSRRLIPTARRRKSAKIEIAEVPQREGSAETIQTIQTLLLKLVRQGKTLLHIQDVSLALLQDRFAEARAVRKITWNHLALQGLKEKGTSTGKITF